MNRFKLKDYNSKDTIAAIATFPSLSALGVIRLSGPKSFSIMAKLFKPAKKKDIRRAKSYTLHYGWIVKKGNPPAIVDEVLVSLMRKPNSYTREDVIEISAHGGILVLNKILELLLKQGVRQALPGEFTYRALTSGRINLIQAEAVRDVIEAKTDQALELAQRQLRGELTGRIEKLKQELKNIFSQTEAYLNFPEDQVELSTVVLRKKLEALKNHSGKLLQESRQARILKEGLKCAICGKTNSGKSTLFNCLLKEERVITSRIAGTTRDVIEEVINIRGIPLRIYDTAGLIESKDLLTRKALKKTREIFEGSDLIIFLVDGSRALSQDDFFLLEKIKTKTAIMVINKIDLKQKLKIHNLGLKGMVKVRLSALKGQGIKDLERAIFDTVYSKGIERQNLIFLSRYQEEFLSKASENISQALENLAAGQPIDLVNFLLKQALDDLGKLTGEVFSEEILENIFSQFCIGK
ncbi:MAG: tRNA uridine-5-carboxymethylaminomethyl(34) synthesis GTPase MnmE [Candidatus Omnitrophota bacterium]